jgi:hypothetical protein
MNIDVLLLFVPNAGNGMQGFKFQTFFGGEYPIMVTIIMYLLPPLENIHSLSNK